MADFSSTAGAGRRTGDDNYSDSPSSSSARHSPDLTDSYVDISHFSPFADSYSPLATSDDYNDRATTSNPATTATLQPSPLIRRQDVAAPGSSASPSLSPDTQPPHLAPPAPYDPPSMTEPKAEQQAVVTEQILPSRQESESQGTATSVSDQAPAAVAAPAGRRKHVARFVEMFKASSPSPSRQLDTGLDTAYHGVGAGSPNAGGGGNREQRPPTTSRFDEDDDDDDDDEDHEVLVKKFNQGPPLDCHSAKDVHVRRRSSLYVIQIILSVYSTVMSGLWLVVAIYQPRYGRGISSSSHTSMVLSPSTASVLSTLFSRTIEMSFVTVFVACLGQVLSRRAFVRQAKGVTLADMTMRNWVVQPGSLFTYWQGIPTAGRTLTGVLALIASLSALFYTTAADALISPKLRFGDWYPRDLQGLVEASYSNPSYVKDTCSTPIDAVLDPVYHGASCLDIKYSGQSYHNLLTFMTEWQRLHYGGNATGAPTLATRPNGKHSLFDNTTMTASWIETSSGDPAALFKDHNRIVNNVTLAMPHPGVYAAATNPINGILQPRELSGVGEYSIRAAVVSPAVNVMCVNMKKSELKPLVYTEWPNVVTEETGMPGQTRGHATWFNEVPPPRDNEWLNRTVVDDIFKWGEKHKRRPPVFQMYPYDYNMITNTTVFNGDAIYLLAKSAATADYTVCQMRSWTTPDCSTQFYISGTEGGNMKAHCEDPDDKNSYLPYAKGVQPLASMDWKNMVDQWRLSMDLNGGISTSNASTSRIMTNLILTEPRLDPLLPSMAEAMAALSGSTLVGGTLGSTFKHYWGYQDMFLKPGVLESFPIVIQEQQFTSSYESEWQRVFYVVLALVFVINVMCFAYLVFRTGMVTDFTEPQNMFCMAINSPPSVALLGSCGGGPDTKQLRAPWRISYSEMANHYYFQESDTQAMSGRGRRRDRDRGGDYSSEGGAGLDKIDEYQLQQQPPPGYHDTAGSSSSSTIGGGISSSTSTFQPEGRYRRSYRQLTRSKIGAWL